MSGRRAGLESKLAEVPMRRFEARKEALSRRRFLGSLAAAGAAAAFRPSAMGAHPAAARGSILTKPIPSSGEALPVVGLGSSITFNVGNDPAAENVCAEVMRAFFAEGGRLIDSSPMYGSSQEVIGYGLKKLGQPRSLFSADKVWVNDGEKGPAQIQQSETHWGVPRFDLLQVHNLVGWEEHLPTLYRMKADGKLRYVGITTSHGRRQGTWKRSCARSR